MSFTQVTSDVIAENRAPARNSTDRLFGMALRPYCVRLKPLTLERGLATTLVVGLATVDAPSITPRLCSTPEGDNVDVKLRLSELLSESALQHKRDHSGLRQTLRPLN